MKSKTSKQLATEAVAAYYQADLLTRQAVHAFVAELGSQRVAAKVAGVTEVHFSNIRNDRGGVSRNLAERIANQT